MTDARRTVWILGAGFSKPLGGPLLPDLLSTANNLFVQALYESNSHIGGLDARDLARGDRLAALTVRTLYAHLGDGAVPGVRLWDDAEAFLDQLDAAAQGGPAASRLASALTRLRGITGANYEQDPSQLRHAARRLVAAACCAFLKDADTNEERWQPYKSWASSMGERDTIVTFNYDRVLEKLGAFDVVLPHPREPVYEPHGRSQALKLHGSVDWHREEADGAITFRETRREEYAIECEGKEIGLATPGPSKRVAAKEVGSLWDGAKRRIQEAEVVVFVGFRFPPSDAEAREQILRAISKNQRPHIEVHLVLGADRTHKDVVRLEHLLRYAMTRRGPNEIPRSELTGPREGMELIGQQGKQSFALTTHPLFAEDFFTVFERHLLWPDIRVLGHTPFGSGP